MIPVSLVVPVRDEEASLDVLLESIEAQTHAPDEVVFVDAGSTDRTPSMLAAAAARSPRVRIVEAGPATPGRARNVGIAAAAHDFVALTDAGIRLDRHWLARLVRMAAADPEVRVVYGAYEPSRGSRFERYAASAYVGPLTPTAIGPVRTGFIASSLVHRDVWRAVGGFPDLRAAEDRIFMRHVAASGCKVAIAPEALVVWQLQPTVAATFRRFRTYSKHNVLAGEERNWHYGVARQYAAAAAIAAAARRRPHLWWLLAVGALARVVATLARKRDGLPLARAFRPDGVAAVAGILAVIDAATFAGWIDAIAERRKGAR